MLARFTVCCSTLTAAALAVTSCTRDTPMQPRNLNPVTQNAVAPPNDNRDSATFVFTLPFDDSTDLTDATVEPGEPPSTCHDSIGPANRSVWYVLQSHQPGTIQVTAQVFGGAAVLTAYFDSAGLGLLQVGCDPFGAPVTFNVDSGLFYYFQVSDFQGFVGPRVFHLQQDSTGGGGGGGGNDNFADARIIPGVPFNDSADFNSATREPLEPGFCTFQSRTVWYTFTPAQTQRVTAVLQSPFFGSVSVFAGTALDSLSFVGCTPSVPLTFTAVAGTTYYIQLQSDVPHAATFLLLPPPPPQANFGFFPFDPSTFDVVQFNDFSFDPGGAGIETRQWSFGDGATATGTNPTHRYAADGAYLVELTVTTFDGRSATTSRTVQVRTRDVAITRFQTPATGRSGRTSRITVDIQSNLNPETVQVQLFRSVPGGFQLVATSVHTLPVRNRTTTVTFSYTFTPDDATIGKVTFRAEATIQGGRDALPADNVAIGDPTKVMR